MIMLSTKALTKTFVLHLHGSTQLNVLRNVQVTLCAGKCLALTGPSGAGKSTLLRALYGNYRVDSGSIFVRHRGTMVGFDGADPKRMIPIRRETLGHVSQFLRAIPRVSTLDVVAAPLLYRGISDKEARLKAEAMLVQLGIPKAMHALPPVTFSGGEQQRVNLARGFIGNWPILLLDEPTASLDSGNRDVVIRLMLAEKSRGAALLGIFHDPFVRNAVADDEYHLEGRGEGA
jgi:alpha-D-ribose 1-methylphosphonate 5-triphosphate synthase subunit PhnL